uniref:DUF676 domain-containing protein n=1 Tax=Kwoniella dejecticola CBS 10117 TaxID=1296121 RepID=A0A1A6A948_9TREE|nr:uncharacterized protein I303_02589 [Kwoniella dejecticola CBS 10117]OBR86581.1 hypothetical protein I303_02589 [Kwoniella dejecticola CBS 10117]
MQPVHLIILTHGLYGSSQNLTAVKEELINLSSPLPSSPSSSGPKSRPLETVVYLPTGIKGPRTWDGIDIDKEIERLEDDGKDVVGFSVMGYSLGGLISRYMIGILHSRQPSFFSRHKPISFSTAATPHLGVLKYGTLTNTVVHTVGRQLFSRTGRQIYSLDKEPQWGGRVLLELMADPGEYIVCALKLFPKVMIIANGCQDNTVPYPTASISSFDPFQDASSVHVETDDDHIVQSYRKVEYPDPEDLPVDHSRDADEDGEDVQIQIKVIKNPMSSVPNEWKGRRRQPLPPPFMLFPWPFNYMLFLIFPLLLPFILVYVTTVITLHNFHSRKRIRTHRDSIEQRPLLVPSSVSLADTIENTTRELKDTLSSSVRESTSLDGTSSPPLSDPVEHSKVAPLLLTSAQKTMIRNLNNAISHAERVVSWFPWAYNSHAMLICRDTKRFPWQEDGRGVVRKWTKFVYDAGLHGLNGPEAEGGSVEIHGRTES